MAVLQSPLKKGDQVVVIAGKDKGKTGRILRVDTKTNRVVVEGANMVKRHQKATQMGQEAKIVNKEAPIAVSNVMMADPKDGKPTRVGMKMLDDGRKVRFAKRSGDVIDS